ncbi:hypothetical protein [Sulfurimonas sp.]|uniref:hypothetical protein n=1 Tax=Sulfurimonas sp. TaxID=2022749 RepID=UPI00286E8964|nr:hypothetical protein [Sulfurimonas sp.]
MNKNKQEFQTILENLVSSMSDDYYLDYYIENYKQSLWANKSDKDKIIKDTVNKFKEYHEDFKEQGIKSIFAYSQKY